MEISKIISGYGEGEKILLDEYGLSVKVGYAAKRDLVISDKARYGVKDYFITMDTETAKTVKVIWYDDKVSVIKMSNKHFSIFTNPKYMNITHSTKPSKPAIECPYCHSTNTQKITTTSKVVHTALWGIFSISRNSKQWHCNNCKSDF